MSDHILGALVGLLASLGLLLILQGLSRRRPGLVARLEPYAQERPRGSSLLRAPAPVGGPSPACCWPQSPASAASWSPWARPRTRSDADWPAPAPTSPTTS
ncbi:hypothetical protein ADENT20671_1171 [Actinomyces denticolens]|nr:hypothetical protein ADENT20671_1171 [Actinomyces denticolens]